MPANRTSTLSIIIICSVFQFQQQYPDIYSARCQAGKASPLTEVNGVGGVRTRRSKMLRSVLKSPSLHASRKKH